MGSVVGSVVGSVFIRRQKHVYVYGTVLKALQEGKHCNCREAYSLVIFSTTTKTRLCFHMYIYI